MPVRIFTLRYVSALGGFDDSEIRRLFESHQFATLREYFFFASDVPHLVCVVTWNESAVPLMSYMPTGAEPCGDAAPRSKGPDPTEGLSEARREAFNRLRKWRGERSREDGVPPYVVFTNKVLRSVVELWPESKNALGAIDGFGASKVERFGTRVLQILGKKPEGEATPAPLPPAAESSASAATAAEGATATPPPSDATP